MKRGSACTVGGCNRPVFARAWCSAHYQRWLARGTTELQDQSVEARFWRKVQKTDGCWLWTAGRSGGGYGVMEVGKKHVNAHRLAWTLCRGEIPRRMFVCHHCDNPPCVRPEHLFLGTATDNTHDMYRKGRGKPPIGERNYWAIRR